MDTTIINAGRILAESQSIVITTHILPDGDGLGAEIALYHYLHRLGKNVRIVNPDQTPQRYQFLDPVQVIETEGKNGKKLDKDFDLAVVMDTHDSHRLGGLWDKFKKHAKKILVLDHHPNLTHPSIEDPQVFSVVDIKSSSIGELLFRLFHQAHDLLDAQNPSFRLSPEIALGLYVSIMTDTNSFRYASTTALAHRIAADLLDYGLDPEEIYQNVYSSKSLPHLRLIGEVLSQVQQKSKVAWVEIPLSLRQKYQATSDDTQSILNYLLLLKEAEIIVLLREEDDMQIKVSIKSKGNIRVNDIAQEFGGGGHEFAAGFVIKDKILNVQAKLVKRLLEVLSS